MGKVKLMVKRLKKKNGSGKVVCVVRRGKGGIKHALRVFCCTIFGVTFLAILCQ